MKTQVVLGTFFGDEGKGSTVQWLCNEAIERGENPIVVRFSGGQQAGHRIIANGIEHICSSFGSGVLLGVPTYLDRSVIIDPICMRMEYEKLMKNGITPKIYICPTCRVTTPYDVNANVGDKKVLGDGSCGMGIFHTFKRCKQNCYAGEIPWHDECYIYNVLKHPERYLNYVREYYGCSPMKNTDRMFIEACEWLSVVAKLEPGLRNVAFLGYGRSVNPTFIFEGSQGLLLDMDCGFMPNCTPSNVGLNGIHNWSLEDAEVFLVMRSYLTRHGNGYEPFNPKQLAEEYFTFDEPTNPDYDFQGKFKHGFFDDRLLMRAVDRHCIDNLQKKDNLHVNLVVTHLDCMIMDDCIPHIKLSGGLDYDSMESFLYNIEKAAVCEISNIYGSYMPQLDKKQFKLLKTNGKRTDCIKS